MNFRAPVFLMHQAVSVAQVKFLPVVQFFRAALIRAPHVPAQLEHSNTRSARVSSKIKKPFGPLPIEVAQVTLPFVRVRTWTKHRRLARIFYVGMQPVFASLRIFEDVRADAAFADCDSHLNKTAAHDRNAPFMAAARSKNFH